MKDQVQVELMSLIEKYVKSDDLTELFRLFIKRKQYENTVWADLTIYAHRMLGGHSMDIYRAAAITELLMLLLDIIDDLQDQDNDSMPWMVCPAPYTLNVILSIFAAILGELGGLAIDSGKASDLLSKSITGQQADISRSVFTEEDYIKMVSNKSGSLLQLACYMGYGMIPELDPKQLAYMNELANIIGIVSQLDNDIRDVVRWDMKNDIWQRKYTLPTIYLLSFSDEDFPILNQYYDGTVTEEQFVQFKEECLAYIERSGCLEYSRVIRTLYIDRAREIVANMSLVEPWKQYFEDITLAPYIQIEQG